MESVTRDSALFKASIFTVIPAKFLATIPLSAGTYRLCCLAGLEEYVLFDYGVSLVRVWSKAVPYLVGTKLFLVQKKIFRTSICSLSDPKSTKDTKSTKDKFRTHFEGTEVSGMFCTCPSRTKDLSIARKRSDRTWKLQV